MRHFFFFFLFFAEISPLPSEDVSPLTFEEVRISTWNILADSYLRPEYYPYHEVENLTWKHRKEQVFQRIDQLNSQILCLQEVEPAIYQELYWQLHGLGYEGVYAKKGRGRPDGSAIFWRDNLQYCGAKILVYNDEYRGTFSGNIALLAKLRLGTHTIGIISTHILFDIGNQEAEKCGEKQVRELIDWMESELEVDEWIVAGDFNGLISSSKVQQMVDAGYVDAFGTLPMATFSHPEPVRIDFIFHTDGLSLVPEKTTELYEAHSLPSCSEPSDHLPLTVTLVVDAA